MTHLTLGYIPPPNGSITAAMLGAGVRPKSILGSTGAATTISATQYWGAEGTEGTGLGTLAVAEQVVAAAFTATEFRVRSGTNTPTNPLTITVLKNGIATALTLSLTVGATDYAITGQAVAFAVNDRICIQTVDGGGATHTSAGWGILGQLAT